jgi:hypothetical protein
MLKKDTNTCSEMGKGITAFSKNTMLALSSSYSGISGSLYLGLKNAMNAQMTHQDMDQPLTIKGGLKKGSQGFFDEIYKSVTGIYQIPRNRIRKQGLGAK